MSLLSPAPQIRDYTPLSFFMGHVDSNAGLYACRARALPTEPSPQPDNMVFDKNMNDASILHHKMC